jgi:phosphatidylserine/phosphatidylglycerophosphate/cardiolipin synthase-like enzyme
VRAPGTVAVLGFGRLGLLGVPAPAGPAATPDRGGPSDPAPCPSGLPYWGPGDESPDWTNERARFAAYDPRNPADAGFRALIASARRTVFIAQQDLHGLCPPPQPGVQPRFDRRLLDAIARRLLAGVDVRVVISTPGATLTEGLGYSYTTSLAQTSSAVLARTRAVAGDAARAGRAVRQHFRLHAIRFGPSRVWPRARAPFNKIANHAKVGMVDDCAVWIGSHNLYPAWLSEYSVLIEDPAVARTFRRLYAEPLWRHSAGARLPGRACT